MVKYITIILFVLSFFSVAIAETNDVELLPSNENNFEMEEMEDNQNDKHKLSEFLKDYPQIFSFPD